MSLGEGAAGSRDSGMINVLETNPSQLDRDLQATLGTEFSASPHPMWIFDQASLAFLAVNDAALRQYGYSREDFLTMTILDIHPEEDIPKVLRHALRPHPVKSERWRHRTKRREILDVELTGMPLLYENRLAQVITVYRCLAAASTN